MSDSLINEEIDALEAKKNELNAYIAEANILIEQNNEKLASYKTDLIKINEEVDALQIRKQDFTAYVEERVVEAKQALSDKDQELNERKVRLDAQENKFSEERVELAREKEEFAEYLKGVDIDLSAQRKKINDEREALYKANIIVQDKERDIETQTGVLDARRKDLDILSDGIHAEAKEIQKKYMENEAAIKELSGVYQQISEDQQKNIQIKTTTLEILEQAKSIQAEALEIKKQYEGKIPELETQIDSTKKAQDITEVLAQEYKRGAIQLERDQKFAEERLIFIRNKEKELNDREKFIQSRETV